MTTNKREKLLSDLRAKREMYDQALKFVATANEELLDVITASLVSNGTQPEPARATPSTKGKNPVAQAGTRGALTAAVRAVVDPMDVGRKFDVHEVHAGINGSFDLSVLPRPKAAIGDVLRKFVGKSTKVVQPGSGTIATIYQKTTKD
jgi:hypothetical protein